jgi:hypothetical protein
MQSVRIAKYTISNSTFQDIADKAKTDLLPKLREQAGFVRYGVADMGDQYCESISVWNTREDAIASEKVAATWVHENLEGTLQLKSSHVGTLAFFEGVPATV